MRCFVSGQLSARESSCADTTAGMIKQVRNAIANVLGVTFLIILCPIIVRSLKEFIRGRAEPFSSFSKFHSRLLDIERPLA